MRTAVPSAWKTKDLPARRASVTLDRVFSREEMDHIRQGMIPEVHGRQVVHLLEG